METGPKQKAVERSRSRLSFSPRRVAGIAIVAGAATASILVPLLQRDTNTKGEKMYDFKWGEKIDDFKRGMQSKFQAMLDGMSDPEKHRALECWKHAQEYAEAGDLFAAGTKICLMEEIMSRNRITPEVMGVRTQEFGDLCCGIANAYLERATDYVTPNNGISPYGKDLEELSRAAAEPSAEKNETVLTGIFRNINPRPHVDTARKFYDFAKVPWDPKALAPFIVGTVRENNKFTDKVGPSTTLGMLATDRTLKTVYELSPEEMSPLRHDPDTRDKMNALMNQLWNEAEEKVQSGDTKTALSAIVMLHSIGQQVGGFPQKVQQVMSDMSDDIEISNDTGKTEEEKLVSYMKKSHTNSN